MQQKNLWKHSFGSPQAWVLWILTSAFYAFQFFLRSCPNAMAPQLMEEFNIGAQGLGYFSAAYYWFYSSLQIPLGLALDALGPKRVLRVGTVVCVLGALLFGLSSSLSVAIAGRCLIGIGAAVAFIGSTKMNGLWFSAAYMAFITGLLSAAGKIAGACANAFLPKLLPVMSWHTLVLLLSGAGFLLTLLIWIFAKDGPEDCHEQNSDFSNFKGIKTDFLQVAKTKEVWILGFYGYSLYLTLSVFSETFSIGFLQKSFSIDAEQAGYLAALVPIGSCIGAPILSFLSDYLCKRVILLKISAFFTLLCSSIVFFSPLPNLGTLQLFLFLFGFFSGGQILVFITGAGYCAKKMVGSAMGIVNSILMFGGAVHNPLVGTLMKFFWNGKMVHGHPFYSLLDYRLGLASISACFFLALVLSFFLKENHPLSKKSDDAPTS
ncbi:MAG: hypothetical protein BGO07_03410 [Alphaproteobacteria bacterium 40-19]|nr:MAG: hypothetical protein BGO07_03410 [Alphaproteobacteria bacterium 40-19]